MTIILDCLLITIIVLTLSFLAFILFVFIPVYFWTALDPRVEAIVSQLFDRMTDNIDRRWSKSRLRKWYSKKMHRLYSKIVLGEKEDE